jgi:hypothetical protein
MVVSSTMEVVVDWVAVGKLSNGSESCLVVVVVDWVSVVKTVKVWSAVSP